MEGIILTSLLSSVGLGISSFFGIFLLRHQKLENRVLAWLLITLSLRITKSIFYTQLELPLMIKNLGLAANLAVGPLLYLYVQVFFGKQKIRRKEYLHFLPTVCYFILSPVLPNGGESVFWKISYSLILIQSFTYVLLSINSVLRQPKKRANNLDWIWALIGSLATTWLVYALIFLGIFPLYTLGPVTFSLLIFILLYTALKHYKLFKGSDSPKYTTSRISDHEGNQHFSKLQEILKSESLYKKSDLSLSQLAEKMGLLERDISLVINKYGNCNFAQFINGFRVEEAKRLIKQDTSKKVIAIAYDSGFSNLGTFNQAFKSVTGLTPSEFRNSS